MESFREMSKEELQAQEVEVNKKYQEFKDLDLSLNMARGKPAPDQIDHANGMLETMTDYHAKDGLDVRNYGVLDGLPEMKEIFSDLLDIPAKNIIVGGNASLNLMFDQMMRLVVFGPSDVISTVISSNPKVSVTEKCLSYPGAGHKNFTFSNCPQGFSPAVPNTTSLII